MKPLPRRRLGTSGLEITPVGFGAWAAGGGGWSFGWGPQDDEASLAAMRRAVDHGVNWIDTAPVYGLGHSEELVGRAAARDPAAERPLVFTKCGLDWDERDRMKQSPPRPPARIRSAASATPRCGAWAWSASTSTSSTGPTRRARRSRTRGRRWRGWSRRARCARSASATSGSRSSNAARRCATWTRSSRRSR